jgi:pentatricopeptide repeat protein
MQLGKPQEALELYKQALRTKQELGNVGSVATTHYAMAGDLMQLGKSQEALEIYEQALKAQQELGKARDSAVTQNAMANALMHQGKMREALALFQQALETLLKLGDVQSAAVTKGDMADVLMYQGRSEEALVLHEQALRTKQELGDVRSMATTREAMANVLMHQGKLEEALVLFEQALETYRELGDVRSAAVAQGNLCQLLLQQSERHRALKMAWEAYTSLHHHGYLHDAQEMQQLLISIKAQVLGSAQFDKLWEQVISNPQPEWLCDVQASSAERNISISVSQEVIRAVRDFVNAENWDATRKVVEAEQSLLFQPEVETIFEQNIAQARNAGEKGVVKLLEMHLALLRACKSIGIAQAFEQLTAVQDEAPPFDAELIPRSVAALLGNPQQKIEHMQYLTAQLAQASDEDLKALLQVIQLALFSKNDLWQLGRNLQGVYREAWEMITAAVEAGGVDVRVFEAIANNTLAVLGPAASRRGEWRNNLVEIRNQVTAHGDSNMAAMLDAVIALLDAGGNPSGLGNRLEGIYAKTWQAIVGRLSK